MWEEALMGLVTFAWKELSAALRFGVRQEGVEGEVGEGRVAVTGPYLSF